MAFQIAQSVKTCLEDPTVYENVEFAGSSVGRQIELF